jgi:hypothetical protein
MHEIIRKPTKQERKGRGPKDEKEGDREEPNMEVDILEAQHKSPFLKTLEISHWKSFTFLSVRKKVIF